MSFYLVAGLPEPRIDHAAVMARFAHDILRKLKQVTADLATSLGPGTASLQMRIGVSLKQIITTSISFYEENSKFLLYFF